MDFFLELKMTILRLLEQMDIRKNGNTLRSIRQIFFDVCL